MYGIVQTDKRQVKKIAGKIIPAIITSTALAAGFEILCLLQALKIDTSNPLKVPLIPLLTI